MMIRRSAYLLALILAISAFAVLRISPVSGMSHMAMAETHAHAAHTAAAHDTKDEAEACRKICGHLLDSLAALPPFGAERSHSDLPQPEIMVHLAEIRPAPHERPPMLAGLLAAV